MNNTFSAARFWKLFRKTLLERPVQMFGLTGLILTVVLLIYIIAKTQMGYGAAQNLAFIWGLPGGSFFLASFVFGYFSSNSGGSSYLTLPASHFEKWLCGILIAGVLFPILFLLFFRAIDAGFVAVYHNSLDPSAPFYKERYEEVFLFDFTSIIAWRVYSIFLILTGAMFIGSLYFNKLAFIKTGIALCLFSILLAGINWLVASIFFGNISDSAPFHQVTIPVGNEEGTIELPTKLTSFFNCAVWYIFPAAQWLLAFTRLREKEF